MRQFFIAISLLLLWSVPGFCQSWNMANESYSFKHYQIEQGLADNTIYCSLQDKRGFLWFGTKNGINRFDGYQFKNIQLTKTRDIRPHSNRVLSIFEDDEHQLWLGGEGALYRYDINADRMHLVFDRIFNIRAISEDHQRRLWFISGLRLYRYDLKTKSLKRFSPAEISDVSTLLITDDGILWLGGFKGKLFKYNADDESFLDFDVYEHSAQPKNADILTMAQHGAAIVIGTREQGIKRFDTLKQQYEDIITQSHDQTPLYVRQVVASRSGEFWCATETGLLILDFSKRSMQWVHKQDANPYALSGNAIYTICRDREGGMWLGTYFAGLNYYYPQNELFRKHFSRFDGKRFENHVVREIRPDGKRGLWVGTEDNGLYQYSFATERFTWHGSTGKPDGLCAQNIHGLMPDGPYLWVGTYEYGIDLLDTATHRVVRHYESGQGGNQLRSNFVLTFLKTRSGALYAGTDKGLYQYNRPKDRFDSVRLVPKTFLIYSLMEDHAGNIWIGTDRDGVIYFNPHTATSGSLEKTCPTLKTTATIGMLEDSRKRLWFATEEKGLIRFDPTTGKCHHYNTANGLTSNYTFKVLEDRNRHIWVSTNGGLTLLNPENGETRQFSTANGLLSDQFNFNSGYADSSHTLYFGSLKGLIAFQPEKLAKRPPLKRIFITAFQINNIEVNPSVSESPLERSIIATDHVTLRHDQSTISFDFASLSYEAPEMIHYRYRLEGLDKEWTSLQVNRRIYFTNLAPGHYKLFVQSSNGIRWDGPVCSLELQVLPPFWATWWAYCLYGILVLTIAYYFFRFYNKAAQVKKEREIFDAKMDFFTNVAHEIKTPLTLIKLPLDNLKEQLATNPLLENEVRTMEKNTNRLVTLIQQILDLRKTETSRFTLDFKKVNLTILLEDVLLQYQAFLSTYGIDCRVKKSLKPIIIEADEEALRKMLTNLVDNAVKHAEVAISIEIIPSPADNQVQIAVENDGEHIPVEVQDRIFEPFFSVEQMRKSGGTGIGLALVKSFATLHNGKVYLQESKVGYTRFVLCLPMEQLDRTNDG